MKNLLVLLILTSQIVLAQTPCLGGFAGSYPCNGIDLQSHLSFAQMGGASTGNDSWGWTDPDTGKEYALIGLNNGTAFIDISDPINPVYLGKLPSHTFNSTWRDIKTYNDYAFIVSEASGHGMQVFDLKRLANVVSPPVTFTSDAHYNGFGNAHNIVINETTGYAYAVGTSTFSGGPHFVDISNPLAPVAAGGFSTDGYSHDAQVVSYFGPDSDYTGREIYIGSNEDRVSIVDVTDKTNPIAIATISYSQYNYTHQGWFTEDQRFFLLGDELDEQGVGFNTRTIVFDLADLDNPQEHLQYFGPTLAIDHNGYIRGNRFYLSNYRAGIRILRTEGLYDQTPSLTEINYFDTYPSSNSASFSGVWNIYPYLESGNLIISDYSTGFYLVRDPNYDNTPPIANCQDITVQLNTAGEVLVNPIDVDNGSTDDFGIVARHLEKTIFTCDDVGDNEITYTVEDDYGNQATCVVTITVEAVPATFIGGSWDIIPNEGSKVVFQDNYNTNDLGNITACSCEIEAGATVTVSAGTFLDIGHDILVEGTLEVLHEGSIVQRNDESIATNNGAIWVHKTTPDLESFDFMILGSPMTSETREGVYGSGRTVRNHVTENFIPNPLVEAIAPGAANWADDNGDNWLFHTGVVQPGEGYLVRPQPTASDSGSYNLEYTLGTLNNGVVNFDVIYNGTQNGSPNVLANPYPSAIDAELFIADNSMINEVYFWEHIQAPDPGYPGYYASNFSMGDISVYNNGSGGVPAANGGETPSRFIASGQGFGIKATQAGTAIFNNSMRVTGPNDNYRTNEIERERIWLQVKNETYGLGSNILVAFTEAATNEYEPNFDTSRMATPVSMYSVIDSGKELIIQGRSAFNEEQEVVIGFSTQVEELERYQISLRDFEGESLSQVSIYLYDKVEESVTNLKEKDYDFLAFAGDYKERFILYFQENAVLDISEFDQDVIVYPNPAKEEITLLSLHSNIQSVTLFDLRGRKVQVVNMNQQGGTYQVDISKLDPAYYLVEIKTSSGIEIKQIIKN